MNDLEQLLKDFYSKYAPDNQPDSTKIGQIKEKYGEDYDALISDLYTKYAPDNIPDPAKLGKIKELYKLSGAPTTVVEQVEEVPERGILDQVTTTLKNYFTKNLPANALKSLGAAFAVGDEPSYEENEQFYTELANLEQTQPDVYKKLTSDLPAAKEFINKLKDDPQKVVDELPSVTETILTDAKKLESQADTEGLIQDISQIDLENPSSILAFAANSVAQGVGQIGTAATTMGSSIILETLGDVYGEAIDDAVKGGKTMGEAVEDDTNLYSSVAISGAVAFLEKTGISKLIGKSATKTATRTLAQAVTKGFLTEAGTEVAQEAVQDIGTDITVGATIDELKDKVTSSEFWSRLGTAGIAGGLTGSSISGGINISQKAVDHFINKESDLYDIQEDIDQVTSTDEETINNAVDEIASDVINEIESKDTSTKDQSDTLTETELNPFIEELKSQPSVNLTAEDLKMMNKDPQYIEELRNTPTINLTAKELKFLNSIADDTTIKSDVSSIVGEDAIVSFDDKKTTLEKGAKELGFDSFAKFIQKKKKAKKLTDQEQKLLDLNERYQEEIAPVKEDIELNREYEIDQIESVELPTDLSRDEKAKVDAEQNEKIAQINKKYDAQISEIDPAFTPEEEQRQITKEEREAAKTKRESIQNLVSEVENRDDINTEEEVLAFAAEQNKNLEGAAKLSEEELKTIFPKYQKSIEELTATNTLKDSIKETATKSSRYKGSEFYKNYIDDYLSVDPKQLKGRKRSMYIRGLGQLLRGGEYDDMVAAIVMQETAKARVAEITADKEFKYRTITDKLGVMNPAQLATYMSKFVSDKADKMMQTFYTRLMRANAQAQLATEKLLIGRDKKDNSLFQISKRNKLKTADHIRTYLYGKLQTNGKGLSPGDVGFDEILATNIAQERKEISNKLIAIEKGLYKKQDKAQVEEELSVLNDLESNFTITPKQQELYDRFKEILGQYEEDAALNTTSIWGKQFNKLTNYMPTFALGKITDSDLGKASDSLVELLDATPEKMNAISSVQSGFTKDRQRTRDVYYDNNILSVASKYITSTVFDINATREIKILNRILKDKDLINHIGLNNVKTIKKGLEGNIRSAVKKGDNFHSWVKAAEYLKNALVVGRMGTAGQLATQYLATLPSSIIYTSPKNVSKALGTLVKFQNNDPEITNLKEFMEKNGLGIQVRDVLFEKFESIEDYNKNPVAQVFKKLGAVSDATTTGILRWSDKLAARQTWLAAFYEAGGDLNNPTAEAITAAERKTILLQNVSDVTFAPELFKTDNQYKRLIISETMAFKSFALQQMLNTYYSLPYIFKRAEARKLFAANVTNSLMYSTMSAMLIQPLYNAIGSMFSGEDEEEEKGYSIGQQIMTNTVFDIFFSGYPGFAESFLKLQTNKYISPSIYGEEGEKFNQYEQSPIYSVRGVKETFFTGPYSNLVEMLDRSIDITVRAADEDEEVPDHEIFSMYFVDAMLTLRTMPFRGEISKIAKQYAKDLEKAEKSDTGGTNPLLSKPKPKPRPKSSNARPKLIPRPKL